MILCSNGVLDATCHKHIFFAILFHIHVTITQGFGNFLAFHVSFCNNYNSVAIEIHYTTTISQDSTVQTGSGPYGAKTGCYVLPNCRPCLGVVGTTACMHCGTLVHLLSWMLFQRWRAPALCLPCVLGTPCSSHFAPHLATNPLSFVTLFLSGKICLPPLSPPLHLYCFRALFVTILL